MKEIPSESNWLPMSFREKSAWASLLAMLVAFVPYFVQVARSLASHGAQAVAVAPHEPVRGVLRLMQLGELLPVVATREEALRALGLE